MADDWSKHAKGETCRAKIHTHPKLKHAIVENTRGIRYCGQWYNSVEEAKSAALAAPSVQSDNWLEADLKVTKPDK